MAKNFSFHIDSLQSGWILGKISLGGGSTDFRMSYVLGDDFTNILLLLLTFHPDHDTVGKFINSCNYHFEDFPCDNISIDEEGTTVDWKITRVDEKSDLLHITVTAERYDEKMNEKPIILTDDVLYEDLAYEIVSAIDELLKKFGLMKFLQEFYKPFPVTEFIAIKSLLLEMPPLDSLYDELTLLSATLRK